ncbi:MAG: ATP-binding cassette domain-containing protein [Arcanobacterium sp.]|nr:ATP-binding cassette domain-containing protein [Arcanobacterium sp.]
MTSEPLIELYQVNLSQYEAGTLETILDDVSFSLPAHSFTTLLGNSGSGRSEIIEILLGFTKTSSGEIKVSNHVLTDLVESELDKYRRNCVHFIGPSENLVPQLTLHQNILLPHSLNRSNPDLTFFSEVISVCQLKQDLSALPESVPHITQQKTAIARAILSPAEIILCENPCLKLKSDSRLEVLSLLRTAVNEFGKTVLLATPEPVDATLTQRVLLLRDGKIIGEVNTPTLFALLSNIQMSEELH